MFGANFIPSHSESSSSDSDESNSPPSFRSNFVMIRGSQHSRAIRNFIYGSDPSTLPLTGQRFSSFNDMFLNLLQGMNAEHDGEQQPANQETINNLQEVKVQDHHYEKKEGTDEKMPPNCAICTFEMEDTVIELACKHIFHKE